jgi:hypothetical protein
LKVRFFGQSVEAKSMAAGDFGHVPALPDGARDKLARLSPGQVMIPQIKKSDIDDNLQEAKAILNHVSWTYAGHTFGFGFPGDSGADALVYWLKRSIDNRLKDLA